MNEFKPQLASILFGVWPKGNTFLSQVSSIDVMSDLFRMRIYAKHFTKQYLAKS